MIVDYSQILWFAAPFIFLAGFIDAIAGGGGLIAVPAYLAAGLHPGLVLGTNKLSSALGTLVSAANYYRRFPFPLHHIAPLIVSALLGSALGARVVVTLDPWWIKIFLLVAVPVVAFFVWRGQIWLAPHSTTQLPGHTFIIRGVIIALFIGFYDGCFGPGTGTFLALALARFCRLELMSATAYAKYINLCSNFAALVTFLSHDAVHLGLGLSLGVLSIGGHFVGSKLALRNGARIIRPLILLVLLLLFGKIIVDLLKQ
jgi:hypothetical protein